MENLTENIIRGNAELAKFMGFKMKPVRGKDNDYGYDYWYYDPNSPELIQKTTYFGVLKSEDYLNIFLRQEIGFGKHPFHKDWNLLMDVVEKIERRENNSIKITKNSVVLKGELNLQFIAIDGGKKDAVWGGCVEYAKYYNEKHSKIRNISQ